MKTSIYQLSVATAKQTWTLYLASLPTTWFQATVSWSRKWGLRYYENGQLIEETNAVLETNRGNTDSYYVLRIGAASSDVDTYRLSENMQISDLRIWETLISTFQVEKLYHFSSKYISSCIIFAVLRFYILNLRT